MTLVRSEFPQASICMVSARSCTASLYHDQHAVTRHNLAARPVPLCPDHDRLATLAVTRQLDSRFDILCLRPSRPVEPLTNHANHIHNLKHYNLDVFHLRYIAPTILIKHIPAVREHDCPKCRHRPRPTQSHKEPQRVQDLQAETHSLR